jgi:hypothetical protein
MPKKQFTTWSFQEGSDCDAVVAEMVETIDKVGKPFMKRNANLLAVYETMQNSGLGIAHQLDYRIPTACVLLDKHKEAEVFLDVKLRAIIGKSDAASELFRHFAGKLRELLATRDREIEGKIPE